MNHWTQATVIGNYQFLENLNSSNVAAQKKVKGMDCGVTFHFFRINRRYGLVTLDDIQIK